MSRQAYASSPNNKPQSSSQSSLSLMDDLPAMSILEVSSLLNSLSLTRINDLPDDLIVNILNRLYSDHLARSRVVSKRFSNISTKVRSVNLLCPLDRYTNSGRLITPFKKIATKFILSMGDVDSISIGVEERANHKSLDVKLDDLNLTAVSFVDGWLGKVCGGLTSLSISDYRGHSRRKWSEVLYLISFHCKNLHELVLKNASLSTKGLSSAMTKLTSLTLAFVTLDDEGLYNVNSCCPSLQILNLIMVEGLKNSQIVNLLHLRTSQFVGSSSAPTAQLPLIHAPNLTRFEVGFGLRIDKIVRCELDLGPEVFHCTNLHELVLKNAWLSTNGLGSPMLMLTSLTLASVRLDDEDLEKVNSRCPSLQILNLIRVEGLKKPQIDLLHLRTCQYVGSSLATTARLQLIHAPNLTRFEVGIGRRIDEIMGLEFDLSPIRLSNPFDNPPEDWDWFSRVRVLSIRNDIGTDINRYLRVQMPFWACFGSQKNDRSRSFWLKLFVCDEVGCFINVHTDTGLSLVLDRIIKKEF